MKNVCLAVLLSVSLLSPSIARAQAMMGSGPPLYPYEKEGPFVLWPASLASAPIYQIGFMVGSFACLPASLIEDARDPGTVDQEKHPSIRCGRGLGTALGWPVYAAVGLPFALLKGLFWDAPRAAFGRHHPAAGTAATAPSGR